MDDGGLSQLDTIGPEQTRAYMALTELPNMMASVVTPFVATTFTELFQAAATAEAERRARDPRYPHDRWTIFASELDRIAQDPKPLVSAKVDALRRASPLADGILKDMVVGYCRLLLMAKSEDDGKGLCGQTLRRPTLEAFLGRLFAKVAGELRRLPELADPSGTAATVAYKRAKLSGVIRRHVASTLREVVPYDQIVAAVDRARAQRLASESAPTSTPTPAAVPASMGKTDPVLDSDDAVVYLDGRDESSSEEEDEDEETDGETDDEGGNKAPITINTGGSNKYVSFDPGDMPIEDAVNLARKRSEAKPENATKAKYRPPPPPLPPPKDYTTPKAEDGNKPTEKKTEAEAEEAVEDDY